MKRCCKLQHLFIAYTAQEIDITRSANHTSYPIENVPGITVVWYNSVFHWFSNDFCQSHCYSTENQWNLNPIENVPGITVVWYNSVFHWFSNDFCQSHCNSTESQWNLNNIVISLSFQWYFNEIPVTLPLVLFHCYTYI